MGKPAPEKLQKPQKPQNWNGRQGFLRTRCGTMPFMAPEVLLEPYYEGCLADVWSVAVVCLELFCGIGVLEKVFNCSDSHRSALDDSQLATAIHESWRTFGSPGLLLTERCLPTLRVI